MLLRRSCWSSNICHISIDSVYTTDNYSGGGCIGKSEGMCNIQQYSSTVYGGLHSLKNTDKN